MSIAKAVKQAQLAPATIELAVLDQLGLRMISQGLSRRRSDMARATEAGTRPANFLPGLRVTAQLASGEEAPAFVNWTRRNIARLTILESQKS